MLAGSEIRESHRHGGHRVQDPCWHRCQPQVTGAALDLLRAAGEIFRIEANAVTDNPLVLIEESRVPSPPPRSRSPSPRWVPSRNALWR